MFFFVFLSSVVEPFTVRVRESTEASLGQALFKKKKEKKNTLLVHGYLGMS